MLLQLDDHPSNGDSGRTGTGSRGRSDRQTCGIVASASGLSGSLLGAARRVCRARISSCCCAETSATRQGLPFPGLPRASPQVADGCMRMLAIAAQQQPAQKRLIITRADRLPQLLEAGPEAQAGCRVAAIGSQLDRISSENTSRAASCRSHARADGTQSSRATLRSARGRAPARRGPSRVRRMVCSMAGRSSRRKFCTCSRSIGCRHSSSQLSVTSSARPVSSTARHSGAWLLPHSTSQRICAAKSVCASWLVPMT